MKAVENQDNSRSQQLRTWYLARLRKQAFVAADNLTPMALMDTDRKFIEEMILKVAPVSQTAPKKVLLDTREARLIAVVAAVILLLVGSTAVSCIALFELLSKTPNPDVVLCQRILFVTGTLSFALGCLGCLILWSLLRTISNLAFQISQDAHSPSTGNTTGGDLQKRLTSIVRSRDEFAKREQLIADAASDIICCFDSELRILTCNSTLEKLLGFGASEAFGKKISAFALAEDIARTENMCKAVRANKQAATFENRVLAANQHALDLRWTVEWSDTENCYFACASNITDQKTLERAKREFIAMIGHDVKIPLAAVLLNIDIVESRLSGLSQSAIKALARAHQSLDRLIGLINELLDFEKLSAGKMRLYTQDVALDELLHSAIEEVSEMSAQKRIRIQDRTQRLKLIADPDKLVRVLVNLISNAIKYSPEGSCVQIHTVVQHDFVELRIQDEGSGIPQQYHQLIFERYERMDHHEQSAIEGTGLGLAIAKCIIESHGGMIGVDSTVGKGSTFWISMPFRSERQKNQ